MYDFKFSILLFSNILKHQGPGQLDACDDKYNYELHFISRLLGT